MRVDLGGGTRPREGHINVDIIPQADMQVDFDLVGRGKARLPFGNDTVTELYSSHCFEHLKAYKGILHEIARICRVGSVVEIRVPHLNNPQAMCLGHTHILSLKQVQHWEEFPQDWWNKRFKMLKLRRVEYVPGPDFDEARPLFPLLSEEQVMRFVPGCCHETGFHFLVRPNKNHQDSLLTVHNKKSGKSDET